MKTLGLLFLTIFLTSCASTVNLDAQGPVVFETGSSMIEVADEFGPPFSVTENESGVSMTYYTKIAKTSPLGWVPIVGLVAGQNSHKIERFILQFDASDILVSKRYEAVKGSTLILALVSTEGTNGNGGIRDGASFRDVGRFFAKKGIFFDQQRWKSQNVGNNYFLKYQ